MRIVSALAVLAVSGPVLAQAPAPTDPFIGDLALGYLSTSGNTDSRNANAQFEVTWDLDGPWQHEWAALAISARTDDVTTAESYSAGYNAQRDLSATSYLVFAGEWRQDEFSGYARQLAETVGYGRRIIDTQRHMLALEGGAGAKQSELITGEELDEAIVRGALDYLFAISDASEFSQQFLIEQGDDNRYTQSTSALKTRIVGNIALVLSFVIKKNSDVPVGIEKTDRYTSIALEYGF
jgi:putative salt-induced outer membrane protein